MLVYRGPNNFSSPGLGLMFLKDEPEEVTPEQAAILMSNNPTPEQAEREKFHDVFELLGESEPRTARRETRLSKGGEG